MKRDISVASSINFYAFLRSNLLKLSHQHVDTPFHTYTYKYSRTNIATLLIHNSISRRRSHRSLILLRAMDGIFQLKIHRNHESRMKSNEAGNRSGTRLEGAGRWYQPVEANFDVYIAHEQGGIQFYRFRIVRWNRSRDLYTHG